MQTEPNGERLSAGTAASRYATDVGVPVAAEAGGAVAYAAAAGFAHAATTAAGGSRERTGRQRPKAVSGQTEVRAEAAPYAGLRPRRGR